MKPEEVKTSGLSPDIRKQFNLLVRHVRGLRPLTGHATEIDRTSSGYIIRPKGGTGTTSTTPSTARWL